ncbi:hypothetical protein RFI_35490, partial [Reticulomyxa filosa]
TLKVKPNSFTTNKNSHTLGFGEDKKVAVSPSRTDANAHGKIKEGSTEDEEQELQDRGYNHSHDERAFGTAHEHGGEEEGEEEEEEEEEVEEVEEEEEVVEEAGVPIGETMDVDDNDNAHKHGNEDEDEHDNDNDNENENDNNIHFNTDNNNHNDQENKQYADTDNRRNKMNVDSSNLGTKFESSQESTQFSTQSPEPTPEENHLSYFDSQVQEVQIDEYDI